MVFFMAPPLTLLLSPPTGLPATPRGFGVAPLILAFAPESRRTLPRIVPAVAPRVSRATCVALRFPLAVRSLPPRAVAPSLPMPVILPALSRFNLLPALVGAFFGAGLALVPPLPLLANLPLASRL